MKEPIFCPKSGDVMHVVPLRNHI